MRIGEQISIDDRMKNKIRIYRTIFFAYIIVVLILSVIPSPEGLRIGGDKLKHVMAFVVFTFLIFISYKDMKFVYIFLWGLGFGILIEFIQYFVPWRSTEMLDVLADVGGIMIGLIVVTLIKKRRAEGG